MEDITLYYSVAVVEKWENGPMVIATLPYQRVVHSDAMLIGASPQSIRGNYV